MRGLLAQVAPFDGEVEANLSRLETVLARCPDVDIAIFPELYLSGYRPSEADRLACEADGDELDRVREAAARHRTAVVVGFAERMESGIANSAACIESDGTLAGVYRKTHLFGERERQAFQEGQELIVVQLAGRRVAPLICFDVEFPEPARAVARAGADLIVTIAANMRPYRAEHALAARARALDNRCPHLYVNRVGSCDGIEFVGGTLAIDSTGGPVAALRKLDLSAGAWAPAGRESPAGMDPPAGTESPAGAQAPAAIVDPSSGLSPAEETQEREQLLEVVVPPAWVDVGSDIDYLGQSRRDLPVRLAIPQKGAVP